MEKKITELDKDIKTLWAKLDSVLTMMLNNQHKCCHHHSEGSGPPIVPPYLANYCPQCLGLCRGHLR